MANSTTHSGSESQFAALTAFLKQDPNNLPLLADAAAAALDESQPSAAADLVARYASLSPLPPTVRNIAGLAALNLGRFSEAARIFEDLLADAPGDPVLRFNLAWARAVLDDHAGAEALIDDAVVQVVPKAAALKVRSLHRLSRLEDALAFGLGFSERNPDDRVMLGVISLVALDAHEYDLARSYAERAGPDNSEGLATLGMLHLAEHRPAEALPLFDASLSLQPGFGRSQLGRGLAKLALGEPSEAAMALDAGAATFGDHLGTWIATGWAAFVAGDLVRARERFETALRLDDTFSECHGSLAAMDVFDGDLETAERRIEVAFRLDQRCFSASLAKSLMLAAGGDNAGAERVWEIALNTPLDATGVTIAQAMVNLGISARR